MNAAKFFWQIALGVMATAWLAAAGTARFTQTEGTNQQPLAASEKVLNPHRTADLKNGSSGSVDSTGWQMATVAGNENWDDRFSLGFDGGLTAIMVNGEDVYVGGTFVQACGLGTHSIAKWDGTSWSALGGGLNRYGPVYAIAVSGTNIYVGGSFTNAGSVSVNGIAKWDGSNWSALVGGVDFGQGHAMAVSGGDLYAGGSSVSGSTWPSIAKWDGSSWSVLLDLDIFDGALAIAVSGSEVYVAIGGGFPFGSWFGALRKWDGSSWSTLASWVDAGVSAIAVSGGDVYVGGSFTNVGAVAANNVAKWDGSNWSALGNGVNDSVNAIAVNGNEVYVGGEFKRAGGLGANNIARWDGSSWSALGSGVNDSVNAMAISEAGDVYVGGMFTQAGGKPSHGFARWSLQPEPHYHDLAVTVIQVPKNVVVSGSQAVTKLVKVIVQNRSSQPETISDPTVLADLVHLSVEPLETNCPPITPVLLAPSRFPLVLKSKSKLKVVYEVTFDCTAALLAGATTENHAVYRYEAMLNGAALDGLSDADVADDICPRSGGWFDPYPDGRIMDKGCGCRKPYGTLGADVLTDVVAKP